MGFFSKIKQNLNHGGVKVRFTSPSTINKSDSLLPIDITIGCGSNSQTVNKVIAQLVHIEDNSRRTVTLQNSPGQSTGKIRTTLAEYKNEQPFTIQANSNQNFHIDIPLNLGGIAQPNKFTRLLSTNKNSYEVRVSVDVDGIALDPGTSNFITIN